MGVQLAAVFQSPEVGSRFQVALSARAGFGARRMPNRIKTTNRGSRNEEEVFMPFLLSARRDKSKARSFGGDRTTVAQIRETGMAFLSGESEQSVAKQGFID